MLIYMAEQAIVDCNQQHDYEESLQLVDALKSDGKYIGAAPLYATSTAVTVRMRNASPMITDGPFAETREQLAGFYLVDAADIDEAVAIAERIPGARRGAVEVRPIVDLPELALKSIAGE